ncbi:unnamed protein product [Dovyalis caffra]|uniref:Uncharacterized protein n=1 Tax=Dovyalis caffra TaxID=77055 RepID=A0AAV1SUP2_9ROSI|nr:unnamed protein product [Dovyalis caffra]
MEPSKDQQPSLDDTSECCESCKLKTHALKALANSFWPHRGPHVKRHIDELLDILSKMLQMGDTFDGITSCTSDKHKPHIKLAAAESVLQLSRRWDLHISLEIFDTTDAQDFFSPPKPRLMDDVRTILAYRPNSIITWI